MRPYWVIGRVPPTAGRKEPVDLRSMLCLDGSATLPIVSVERLSPCRIASQGESVGLFSKKTKAQTYVPEFEPAPQVAARVKPTMPAFDDPDDVTRWETFHSANSLLVVLKDKFEECFEKAQKTEKAYAMGNTEFVDGVRQHEMSRKNFHDMGVKWESELGALLAELRVATLAAREQWQNLLFLLPDNATSLPPSVDHDIVQILGWSTTHGVDLEIMNPMISNALLYMDSDFGSTLQSFWAENGRISALADRLNAQFNQANQ